MNLNLKGIGDGNYRVILNNRTWVGVGETIPANAAPIGSNTGYMKLGKCRVIRSNRWDDNTAITGVPNRRLAAAHVPPPGIDGTDVFVPYSKKGYRQDDSWNYSYNQHTWIMVPPGVSFEINITW